MAAYNIVAVRRTPNQLTGPSYTEQGLLAASSITLTDHRTLKPAEGKFTVNLDAVDSDTKTSLRDLVAQPLEVWAYRDSVRVFAGPVVGGQIKGNNVTLDCRGRLVYLGYMRVTTDKTWAATDLFTIGKTLVDDWQALDYGNFGVLTASIGTLGTTRNYEVPGASEFPRVDTVLKDVARGNFDVWLDPSTGNLEFAAARGTDLSTSVVIERGIAETEAGFALGPGVVASENYATGTSPGASLSPVTLSHTTVRTSFGRAGWHEHYDPVVDANHLTDLGTEDRLERSTVYFSPGGELFEVQEATYSDLEPGNTVEYSYDAGLGKTTFDVKVEKRQLKVGKDGTDHISVQIDRVVAP